MKITKIGLLVYILLNIVACRQEKKSEIKKSKQKKEKKVSISSNTVYLANVNEKYGTDVLTKTNIKSKSIGVLSHNTKVEILRATGKFEEIELYNKKKVLGQWLEIFYPNKKIYLGDCSAYNPAFNLGHSSTGAHSNGNAFDCRFLKSDGSGSNNIHNLTKEDIKMNAKFIKILKETGHFSKFYTDKGKIPGSIHSSGHDNHIHGN